MERKKSEVTKTSEQTGLEPETIRFKNLWSINLGYLRVEDCRWKKSRLNHFGDRHAHPVPAPCGVFDTHWLMLLAFALGISLSYLYLYSRSLSLTL